MIEWKVTQTLYIYFKILNRFQHILILLVINNAILESGIGSDNIIAVWYKSEAIRWFYKITRLFHSDAWDNCFNYLPVIWFFYHGDFHMLANLMNSSVLDNFILFFRKAIYFQQHVGVICQKIFLNSFQIVTKRFDIFFISNLKH